MPRLSDKYIAGFLDSDGSIGLRSVKGSQYPALVVTFSQKTSQDEVLYRVQEVTGGSVCDFVVNGYPNSRLTVSGKAAARLLERIGKHIVVKRHYAYALLDRYGKSADRDELKAYIREQRKMKSLPLPVFPARRWLAGYFDGDGCLSATVQFGISARPISHIACSAHDTEGIEIIQKNFGGKIHPMCDGRVRQYVLGLQASKAKEFLGYFSRHLIIKKEQAQFILGCAAMGHYRDGKNIKAALKQLKAQPHRLNEPTIDIGKLLSEVKDLPRHRNTFKNGSWGLCHDGGRMAHIKGCTSCGTTQRRHVGKGLCTLCYHRTYRLKRQSEAV